MKRRGYWLRIWLGETMTQVVVRKMWVAIGRRGVMQSKKPNILPVLSLYDLWWGVRCGGGVEEGGILV